MYSQSSYHSLLHLFQRSFKQLNKSVTNQQLEGLCLTVHQVMSASDRHFHAEQHILDMSSSDTEGVETLAILCHDLVYAQIDKGLPRLLTSILKEFSLDENYNLVLPSADTLTAHPYSNMVHQVFGFSPGQKLTPFSGLNEFLSTFAGLALLKDHLNSWEQVQLAACIESTIPFRAKIKDGESPSELLAKRLTQFNLSENLSKTSDDITQTVQMAVEVSNRDVSGFGASDPGQFLNGSWKLIIESNPILGNPLATVAQYRNALAKMEGFYSFLKPEIIFREYQGKPSATAYSTLLQKASENLKVGTKYLQTKIVAMDILRAVCDLSGGDAPIVLFTGTVSSHDHKHHATIEHHLDQTIPVIKDDLRNVDVLRLLKLGRPDNSSFDLKHSPIASYIYERTTTLDLERIILASKTYGANQIDAMAFLKQFDPVLIYSLLFAFSKIAETRAPQIHDIIKKRDK